MSDKDVAAGQEPAGGERAAAPEVPVPAAGQPKSHEPFILPGRVSTQELRARARRRREAEEKLQQHLLEAKEKPAGGLASGGRSIGKRCGKPLGRC